MKREREGGDGGVATEEVELGEEWEESPSEEEEEEKKEDSGSEGEGEEEGEVEEEEEEEGRLGNQDITPQDSGVVVDTSSVCVEARDVTPKPPKLESEEAILGGVVEPDAIPLLVPEPVCESDMLLYLEEEEEEEGEISEQPFLIEVSSTQSSKPLIQEVSVMENSTAKEVSAAVPSAESEPSTETPFRPVIEVIASSSDPQLLHSETTSAEMRDTDTGVAGEQWAITVSEEKGRSSEDENGETMVVEEIEDIELVKPEPFTKSHDDDMPGPLASETQVCPVGELSEFNFADVPLVDPDTIQQVDAALEGIRGKCEAELTQEEKVWKLAACGGSSLDQEREDVGLDPETKSRLKHTLQQAGVLDKVSLKF